jgi:hypothetical protein
MQYSQDEFVALIDAIELDGGAYLEKLCPVREYTFTGEKKPNTLVYQREHPDVPALFEIPYEATNSLGESLGVQPIEACAVEDDIGAWPRFGGDRLAAVLDEKSGN